MKIDKTIYQNAISLFRANGTKHSVVARKLGITTGAARTLYMYGVAGESWGIPIRDIIHKDSIVARALISEPEVTPALAKLARIAAIDAAMDAAETGGMVRESKELAGQLLMSSRSLREAGRKLTTAIACKVEERIDDLDFTIEEGLEILQKITTHSEKIVQLAQLALKYERLSLGEPEEILALVAPATDEELREKVEQLHAAVERKASQNAVH